MSDSTAVFQRLLKLIELLQKRLLFGKNLECQQLLKCLLQIKHLPMTPRPIPGGKGDGSTET